MNKKGITVVYIILIMMIVPYLIFFINVFTGQWMDKTITNILWLLNLYFSTPGLIIIGIILLCQGKKVHSIIGIGSIMFGVAYLGLLIWAMATGI